MFFIVRSFLIPFRKRVGGRPAYPRLPCLLQSHPALPTHLIRTLPISSATETLPTSHTTLLSSTHFSLVTLSYLAPPTLALSGPTHLSPALILPSSIQLHSILPVPAQSDPALPLAQSHDIQVSPALPYDGTLGPFSVTVPTLAQLHQPHFRSSPTCSASLSPARTDLAPPTPALPCPPLLRAIHPFQPRPSLPNPL